MVSDFVRGATKLIAAASGMLLLFRYIHMWGAAFPAATPRQMAETVAFFVPWTLLLGSAFHNLSQAARREWVFWAGILLVFALFILVSEYTSNTVARRAGLPSLACAVAILPHVLRRLSWIYSAFCIVAGLVGMYTLYGFVRTFTTDLYAHDRAGAVYLLLFSVACIAVGGSAVAPLFHRNRSRQATTQ